MISGDRRRVDEGVLVRITLQPVLNNVHQEVGVSLLHRNLLHPVVAVVQCDIRYLFFDGRLRLTGLLHRGDVETDKVIGDLCRVKGGIDRGVFGDAADRVLAPLILLASVGVRNLRI